MTKALLAALSLFGFVYNGIPSLAMIRIWNLSLFQSGLILLVTAAVISSFLLFVKGMNKLKVAYSFLVLTVWLIGGWFSLLLVMASPSPFYVSLEGNAFVANIVSGLIGCVALLFQAHRAEVKL